MYPNTANCPPSPSSLMISLLWRWQVEHVKITGRPGLKKEACMILGAIDLLSYASGILLVASGMSVKRANNEPGACPPRKRCKMSLEFFDHKPDLVFVVGDDKNEFFAHSTIMCCASEVFECTRILVYAAVSVVSCFTSITICAPLRWLI